MEFGCADREHEGGVGGEEGDEEIDPTGDEPGFQRGGFGGMGGEGEEVGAEGGVVGVAFSG
ncbi:MAG: hypothetical protein RI897_1578, partial [Verrucomicrobiota bacterium]